MFSDREQARRQCFPPLVSPSVARTDHRLPRLPCASGDCFSSSSPCESPLPAKHCPPPPPGTSTPTAQFSGIRQRMLLGSGEGPNPQRTLHGKCLIPWGGCQRC